MTTGDVARLRLRNQHLAASRIAQPAEVVSSLGAVQAQDYHGSLWAVGQRAPGATEADVERALAERAFIRTWPLRGTLHFVSAADARWMLALAPVRLATAARYQRQRLELDGPALTRCRKAAIKALRGGTQLTRDDLYRVLDDVGVSTAGGRGLQIVWELAQEAIVCFGPRRGKQHTFALFDEWVPPAPARTKDEALAELALRYFTSRGPATLADFAWWSGLAPADAKAALAMVAPRLVSDTIDGTAFWFSPSGASTANRSVEQTTSRGTVSPQTMSTRTASIRTMSRGTASREKASRETGAHVLPPYDEYTVAYTDRAAALDPSLTQQAKYGIFGPTLVINGRIAGAWTRTIAKGVAVLQVTSFAPLKKADARAARLALARHAAFLGLPADITIVE